MLPLKKSKSILIFKNDNNNNNNNNNISSDHIFSFSFVKKSDILKDINALCFEAHQGNDIYLYKL